MDNNHSPTSLSSSSPSSTDYTFDMQDPFMNTTHTSNTTTITPTTLTSISTSAPQHSTGSVQNNHNFLLKSFFASNHSIHNSRHHPYHHLCNQSLLRPSQRQQTQLPFRESVTSNKNTQLESSAMTNLNMTDTFLLNPPDLQSYSNIKASSQHRSQSPPLTSQHQFSSNTLNTSPPCPEQRQPQQHVQVQQDVLSLSYSDKMQLIPAATLITPDPGYHLYGRLNDILTHVYCFLHDLKPIKDKNEASEWMPVDITYQILSSRLHSTLQAMEKFKLELHTKVLKPLSTFQSKHPNPTILNR